MADELESVGEAVTLEAGMVMPEEFYQPPVKQLLLLGRPPDEAPQDYAAMGLARDAAPALIRMATDELLHEGPQDSPVVYAPIHAWRALGQLRTEEAIAPLVELFRRVDDSDDWVSDDLPKSLAQFGAPALGPVTDYLSSASHGDWSRAAAARTIGLVAERHPELRADCLARLSAQLERFGEQSETLNAFLIVPLWDLRAVETMPIIERAFASGRVDESVQGDMEDVQIEFGLKTKREHPPKPNSLTIMGDEFRARWKAAGLPLPDVDGAFPELPPPPDDFLDADIEPPAISAPYLASPKVGRNEPCPCGSGRKFKKCCGG